MNDTSAPKIRLAPEREDYLLTMRDENRQSGRPFFAGVQITSIQEIYWIVQECGWVEYPDERSEKAVDLSGAILYSDDTDSKIDFRSVSWRYANFRGADLQGASLSGAYLEDADFSEADLGEVELNEAILERANFTRAYLVKARMNNAHLDGAIFIDALLDQVEMNGASLTRANLCRARLNRAILRSAHLYKVNLSSAHLGHADLRGADLRGAVFDDKTILSKIKLSSQTRLGDIDWNDASLAHVDWTGIRTLGDEILIANRGKLIREENKGAMRVTEYRFLISKVCRDVARAYHGLVVTLERQGLDVPASRFRVREQRMEKHALRFENRRGAWVFSSLLDSVAGYGERPGNVIVWYLIVVSFFALGYYLTTNALPPRNDQLSPLGAIFLSILSFHGRGFIPGSYTQLGGWAVGLAAIEAVIGLSIEAIFVATLIRRIFSD